MPPERSFVDPDTPFVVPFMELIDAKIAAATGPLAARMESLIADIARADANATREHSMVRQQVSELTTAHAHEMRELRSTLDEVAKTVGGLRDADLVTQGAWKTWQKLAAGAVAFLTVATPIATFVVLLFQ